MSSGVDREPQEGLLDKLELTVANHQAAAGALEAQGDVIRRRLSLDQLRIMRTQTSVST